MRAREKRPWSLCESIKRPCSLCERESRASARSAPTRHMDTRLWTHANGGIRIVSVAGWLRLPPRTQQTAAHVWSRSEMCGQRGLERFKRSRAHKLPCLSGDQGF